MKYAQLPTGFMLMSIIGFFISIFAVYPVSKSYGFAFTLVFVIMFVSSIISMTRAEVETRDLLYLHGMPEHAERHRQTVKEKVRSTLPKKPEAKKRKKPSKN